MRDKRDMFIEVVLGLLALAAAGSALAAWRRSRRGGEPPALPSHPRAIVAGELRSRDVVTYLGEDYVVDEVIGLDDGGQRAVVVAAMTGDGGSCFLVVDLLDSPRCVLARPQDASELGDTLPGRLIGAGEELTLSRRASVRVHGDSSSKVLPRPGPCEYGVYTGPGAQRALALVPADGAPLLLIGEAVTEEALVLLPGDEVDPES